MKNCRNLLAAAFVAVSVTGCIPPLTTLNIASTAPGSTPGTSLSINLGQQAVLNWTGATIMPYGTGMAQMDPRVYKITPSDAYAAPLSIAENCAGLLSDWTCLKTKRAGSFTVTPYVSGTYTLTADETVKGIIPASDKATFSAKPVSVTVTVNQDVLIADVIGQVTDTKLKGCINALGLTRVNEVTNLSCTGAGVSRVLTLAGLEYFYALQTLDISGNLVTLSDLQGVHALAPRYIANPQVINLYSSGLNCAQQNAIQAALVAKNPAVAVTKGTSSSTCP